MKATCSKISKATGLLPISILALLSLHFFVRSNHLAAMVKEAQAQTRQAIDNAKESQRIAAESQTATQTCIESAKKLIMQRDSLLRQIQEITHAQ